MWLDSRIRHFYIVLIDVNPQLSFRQTDSDLNADNGVGAHPWTEPTFGDEGNVRTGLPYYIIML